MNAAYKYDILEQVQDEQFDNEFFQDEEYMPKTLNEINVSELMGTDHTVWITRNSKFGFDVEIQNDEETFVIFKGNGVHPYAVESLADFCRSFLHTYSNLLDKEV